MVMMADGSAAGALAGSGGASAGACRGYVCPRRDQLFLLPVSMREWLEEGHLAWFVLDVVAQLETGALHRRGGGALGGRPYGPGRMWGLGVYPDFCGGGPSRRVEVEGGALHRRAGGSLGRRPYEPEMMCALVLYAYCCGLRSSRRIEAGCRTDAAFRVICGGLVPDHATIARFVADQEQALAGLFVSGLRLCAAAGLVDLSVVALDGAKLAANASPARNPDAEWTGREVAKLMAATAQEDRPADAPQWLPGIEAVSETGSPAGRLGRLRAALALIEADDAAAAEAAQGKAQMAAAEAARGRQMTGRKPTEPRAALA